MTPPQIFNKNNHTYRFIKQVNDIMYLYEEEIYKYNTCFLESDFWGTVKEDGRGKRKEKIVKYG